MFLVDEIDFELVIPLAAGVLFTERPSVNQSFDHLEQLCLEHLLSLKSPRVGLSHRLGFMQGIHDFVEDSSPDSANKSLSEGDLSDSLLLFNLLLLRF